MLSYLHVSFPLLHGDNKQKHQACGQRWALKRVAEDDLTRADRTLQAYINLSAKQEERYWSLPCLLDAERAAPELPMRLQTSELKEKLPNKQSQLGSAQQVSLTETSSPAQPASLPSGCTSNCMLMASLLQEKQSVIDVGFRISGFGFSQRGDLLRCLLMWRMLKQLAWLIRYAHNSTLDATY